MNNQNNSVKSPQSESNRASQKGNLYLIIAIIVGVVAIGAVGFASWKYFGGGSELEKEKTQSYYSPEQEKTIPQIEKQEEIIPSKKADETASIKILSPNGEEELTVGKTYDIKWNCPDNAEANVVDIYIQDKRLSDKGIFTQIGSLIKCSLEKYSWQIKDISSGENCFKIQLRHIAGSASLIDESDNYFSIKSNGTPSIKVFSPNGGEKWKIGSKQTIKWNTQNIPLTHKIAIHIRKIRSPGSSGEGQECDPIIFTELKNDGKEDWVISEYPEGNYIIEVVSYKSIPITKSISDESNTFFQIVK